MLSIGQIPFNRLVRPLRFGLVGVSGIIVNSTILWALVHGPRLAIPLASALATEAAILSNFLLNDRWTFREAGARRGTAARRLLRFNGVALGGMLITLVVLTLLTSYTQLALLAANVLAVGAATAWNYAINSRWTWASAQSEPRQPPRRQDRQDLIAELRAVDRGSLAAQPAASAHPRELGLLWGGDGRLLTEQDEESLL